MLRQLLLVGLLVAGGMSLANVIFDRQRNVNVMAFVLVIAAVALGGSRVRAGGGPGAVLDAPRVSRGAVSVALSFRTPQCEGDGLTGSRQHMLELIFTRVCVLAPLYILGFSEAAMNGYVRIVGFQAVFNHASVHLPWGPLTYVRVTPNFHHWHHARDDEAIDQNDAAHYAFIDYLFDTTVKSGNEFPARYGVLGDDTPEGFLKQQAFPFRRSTKPLEAPAQAD